MCEGDLPPFHPVLKRENALILQSGVVVPDSEGDSLNHVQVENVGFADSAPVVAAEDIGIQDATYTEDSDSIAKLGDFLERPVLVDSFTWNESDTYPYSRFISPWKLYFANQFIKKKIENYGRVRCTLRVTFRFAASPFYYGLMRACYDPLKSQRCRPTYDRDLIPLSQMPGVWISPQETNVVEMTMPFVWPHNWLNVMNGAEFDNIGELIFTLYSPLRSANGATGTGITISTYVSAENVEVMAPTVQLALQSGVISGPASAIAAAAGEFRTHPKIGPYARAVQVGSTLVASIARMFGFSNPPVMENVRPVQNKAFHAFANIETSVPIDKLAVDPANEVTIDNCTTGFKADDELIITSLCGRVSYLNQVNWSSADAVGTKLASVSVSPDYVDALVETNSTLLWHTPSSMVARMFRFWHGTMRYRIRVVRSKYHKGRLTVSWDPSNLTSASGIEAATFTQVFDLASAEDEFIFEIPYKATAPWLKCDMTLGSIGIRSDATFNAAEHNGKFTIGVLNALTAPIAASSVDIIIMAEAMSDIRFAAPRALPRNVTPFALQSGPIDGSGMPDEKDEIARLTVGEHVASLRALLHRASLSYTQYLGYGNSNGDLEDSGTFNGCLLYDRTPLEYGFDPRGVGYATSIIATGLKRANFAVTHPVNWVLNCFVGYRGSMVVHANVSGNVAPETLNSLTITRTDHSKDFGVEKPYRNSFFSRTGWVGANSLSQKNCITMGTNAYPTRPTGHGGMTVTNGRTQTGLSAVIPQYSPVRFYPAWALTRDLIPTNADRNLGQQLYDGFRVDGTWQVKGSPTQTWPVVDMYFAAGVDFNPVFFVCVPRLNQYTITGAGDVVPP